MDRHEVGFMKGKKQDPSTELVKPHSGPSGFLYSHVTGSDNKLNEHVCQNYSAYNFLWVYYLINIDLLSRSLLD